MRTDEEYAVLGKTCDVLGKKNHALTLENERLRGALGEAQRETRNAQHRAQEAFKELLVLRTAYEELLLGVGNKYPGESRHQTALRYIQRAEGPTKDAQKGCQA